MILRKKSQTGFTLVELLVTITIFVILTGVVLFNQSKFNSTILLTNLSYDIALTIRQAQTYGINIKEFDAGGTDNFYPYGVHFDKADAPKSFILFADTSYSTITRTGDGLYNNDNAANLSSCNTVAERARGCVKRYNIQRGNYISDLIVSDSTGTTSVNKLDIVFQRPNPDAHIRANNVPMEMVDATIVLKGSDGSERKIFVAKNGLIQISH